MIIFIFAIALGFVIYRLSYKKVFIKRINLLQAEIKSKIGSFIIKSDETKFIGKVSMGYSWLVSTAGPQVKQYLAKNPKANVIFAFGINDLGNVSQYISYYKTLIKRYPNANFRFMSVNPPQRCIC